MEPAALKERYGDRITFWGGGIDTQHTLPFGTPDEVRAMVRERLADLRPRAAASSSTPIHNVQAGVPVENLLALYDAVDRIPVVPTHRKEAPREPCRN